MIQLLFTLLTGEVAVVLLLIIKNPFRKLVALAIDRIKRGRGPFVVRTVSATVFVLLFSSLHSMFKIQNKSSSTEMGILTPTDQVLWSRHFLESSLMGYSLLLILIIDRTHHFIKEIRRLRKSMEAVVSQSQATDGGKNDSE